MKSLKHLSLAGLACTVLASTLPTGCASQLPTTSPSASASPGAAATASTNGAAITGVVYSGRAIDGRLVPPTETVTIQVLDRDQEIATTQTDALGRFYLSNIPAPKEGKNYTIKIANVFEQQQKLFPGRVLNLSSIQAQPEGSGTQQSLKVISGTLLRPDQQPLADVEVRDKEFPFRKTKTNTQGQFTLEVASKVIEIVSDASQPAIPIDVNAFSEKPILTVDTNNVHTINGTVMDSTNSNVPLADVQIRVRGSNVSTRSDKQGKFTLNGAPIGPFILEAQAPTGYSQFSVQIPPATFDNNDKPQSFTQNIGMQPLGSILINFHAEDAPYLPSADGTAFTGTAPTFCLPSNCRIYDIQPADSVQETFYHNSLGTEFNLRAVVSVEGTNLSQEVEYPASELLTLRGSDAIGDTITLPQAVRSRNRVVSVKLDNVPGGRQTVTISLTGYQTQKSIPVYIPPNDTISTELITLFQVQQVNSLGDVKGIIKGLEPNLPGTIKIAYLDLTESQQYIPRDVDTSLPNNGQERVNPDLLQKIANAVTSPRSAVVDKATGQYYLKNVPTGSRIMLAVAMVDATGTQLSDCYIPNTSVLLNVRASQINLAPDLDLTRRPLDCTAASPSPSPSPTP